MNDTRVPPVDRMVGRLFRVWSRVYDRPLFQKPFYRRVHAAVMRALDEAAVEPRHVLDIGCGTAQLTADLAERYPGAVTGVDFSQDMMTAARRRLGARAPSLCRANVYALPFASGSVELVTSTISYHWYLEHRRALAEIRRVLAPGGLFVLATMVSPLRAEVARTRIVPTHDHLHDLRAAGFQVEHSARVWPNVRVFSAIAQ